MHSRLTTKEKLVFFLSRDIVWEHTGRIFPLHENYIKWGTDVVATFFVQSLLLYEAEDSVNPYRKNGVRTEAVGAVYRKVLDWMKENHIRADFIAVYRQTAAEALEPNQA